MMNDFQECVRHLWNTYFLRGVKGNDWDLCDRFNDIEIELFRALVLRPLNREDAPLKPAHWMPQEPLSFLSLTVTNRSNIHINRGVDTGYWDDPVDAIWKEELDLRFIGQVSAHRGRVEVTPNRVSAHRGHSRNPCLGRLYLIVFING